MAVGSFSSEADMLDVESREINHFVDDLSNYMAFSPDGKMLVVGTYVTFHIPEITAIVFWYNENPTVEDLVETQLEKTEIIDSPIMTDFVYASGLPKYSITFPIEPKVTSNKTSKRMAATVIKCLNNNER